MTNRDRSANGPTGGGHDPDAATHARDVGREDEEATRLSQEPQHTLPPGSVLINTYKIERFIAKGGMGEVYCASHVVLGTTHAIKIIQAQFADDENIARLFVREANVLRNIRDEAIVGYDGAFRDEKGRLFLSMEYVDGQSLKDILRERPFPPSEIRRLRDRLARGLAAAHDKGIVHRDLSPDNIILPGGLIENAKIIDFGIAKLEDPEVSTIIGENFAGKLSYASPEQLGMYGGQIGPPSDIYSLGLILAAAATGKSLDMGKTYHRVMEARRQLPDLSRVPPELRDELSKMLAPEPKDRPQTMRDLIGLGEARPGAGAQRPWGKVGGGLAALAAVAMAAYILVADPSLIEGVWPGGEGAGNGGNGDVVPPEGSEAGLPPARLETIRAEARRIVDRFDCADVSLDVGPDGRIYAFGSIGTRGDLRALQEDLAGIQDVPAVDNAMAVVPCSEAGPDAASIRRSAERIIGGFSCAAISVDVSNDGHVALFGTLGSTADIRALTEQLRQVEGVAGIDNALAVSPCPVERPTRDAVMAEIRPLIEGFGCGDITATLGEDYRLSVSGTVPRRQEVAILRRQLANVTGVAGVESSLSVAPCPSAPAGEADDPQLAALRDRVEQVANQFRCADISTRVSEDGRVVVAGHVGSDRDRNALFAELEGLDGVRAVEGSLEVFVWPFCEVVSIVNENASLGAGGPSLSPNREDGRYEVGDVLVVEATAGDRFDGYLYVEYIDQGIVAHLMPSSSMPDAAVAAGETVRLGVTQEEAGPNQDPYIVGGPAGRKMLLAISSPEPLFPDDRPPYAEARPYLRELSEALRRASRQGDQAPLATFIMLDVER